MVWLFELHLVRWNIPDELNINCSHWSHTGECKYWCTANNSPSYRLVIASSYTTPRSPPNLFIFCFQELFIYIFSNTVFYNKSLVFLTFFSKAFFRHWMLFTHFCFTPFSCLYITDNVANFKPISNCVFRQSRSSLPSLTITITLGYPKDNLILQIK